MNYYAISFYVSRAAAELLCEPSAIYTFFQVYLPYEMQEPSVKLNCNVLELEQVTVLCLFALHRQITDL